MNNPIMPIGKQILTADNEYLCKQLEPIVEAYNELKKKVILMLKKEDKENPLLLNTFAKIREVPVGTKVKGIVGYRPKREKFHLFYSQGIQTDDIGGWYETIPEQKGKEVIGIVIEDKHPHGKKPHKLFKFLQWTDENDKVKKILLKSVSKATIVIE